MKTSYRVAGIVICIAALIAIQVWRRSAKPVVPAYVGDSSGLKATVIVPTLDTPMPPGKNVIWCSSFQIAWNHLKDDVVKAPVQVKGAEDVAKRLNAAPQSEKYLSPESYYAAAGYINQGIAGQIRSAMAQKFPNATPPTFDVEKTPELNPIVAYAYLAASVKFTKPYNDGREPMVFTDASGTKTPVAAFGFGLQSGEPNKHELANQVAALWCNDDIDRQGRRPDEYAADLCRDSQPNQIVAAVVKPKATLAETYRDIQAKIDGVASPLDAACMSVPKTAWKVIHRLKELEGKPLTNSNFDGYYISLAQQDIDFKLDQSGAVLISEATIAAAYKDAASPLALEFNRPFLIFMRKRGATEPFFVMWVDNAELLTKR